MSKSIKKHYSYLELKKYLNCDYDDRSNTDVNQDHLDSCKKCWNIWNKVRWDLAKGKKGLLELKEYLGDDFMDYYDSSWALAKEWNNKNPLTKNEIFEFYKNTKNYLFNLVIWYESNDRRDFHKDLQALIEKFSIRSVIDFGCGVGSDCLFLLENNIKTYMVDFLCPSVDFLNWRIKKRGLLNGKFIDVDKMSKLPKGELFWAIDVLEHIPDPVEVVLSLSDSTKVFVHCSRFNDKAGGRHPCHINFEENKLNIALNKKGFINIPWKELSVWIKKDFLVGLN